MASLQRGTGIGRLNNIRGELLPIAPVLEDLNLNQSWIVANCALALHDIMIERIAEMLGVPIMRGTEHVFTAALVPQISKALRGRNLELPTDHRLALKKVGVYAGEYRNKVVHHGKIVTEGNARDIAQTAAELLEIVRMVKKQTALDTLERLSTTNEIPKG